MPAAPLQGGDRNASPGAGKEAGRRYESLVRQAERTRPAPSEQLLLDDRLSDLLTWVFRAPDRTVSTAGRDRPAPWNPRSGFEGEGANQGGVSRPKRSGGRVTTTEKKLIARSRLSPTKEATDGTRATLAQESGASASLCGRGADCASAREAVVRRDPEAEREPLGGGRARVPGAGGAERSPALTDDGTREGGRGRTTRQAVHKAGMERRRAGKRDAMGRGKLEGRGSHREACVCRRVNLVLCCSGNNQAYAPRDNPASLRRVVRGAQAGHWSGFFAGWIRCH